MLFFKHLAQLIISSLLLRLPNFQVNFTKFKDSFNSINHAPIYPARVLFSFFLLRHPKDYLIIMIITSSQYNLYFFPFIFQQKVIFNHIICQIIII
jgi:hypothetical protein